MKIRIISLLLVFVTVLLCLASCKGGSNGGEVTLTNHTHQYDSKWSRDEGSHWHACTVPGCTMKWEQFAHTYVGSSCSVCKYTRGSTSTDSKWDSVNFSVNGKPLELTMQLSEYDDAEMTSGAKKYMAADKSSEDKVQDEVYRRNQKVSQKLGIHMNYTYINEPWNSIQGKIKETEDNGKDVPDLYCDMIYDMMSVSLEDGVFVNLYRYTTENLYDYSDGYYLSGYFDFTDENGYLTNYMSDLSLTDDKQFLIASNYFMDVIRALIVLPFNIDLYATLVDKEDQNAYKLFELVKYYNWTWDEVAKLNTIYTGSGDENLSETLVMAIPVDGLSAIALTYSTSFQTYTAVRDENGKITGYKMEQSCDTLAKLFSKIADVVNTRGFYADPDVLAEKERKGQTLCRSSFKNGTILFAAPTMLGALESVEFQQMQDRFGVLPMPKLQAGTSTPYASIINGTGKVGALSFHSGNQQAMSAWVQYSSEESYSVLTTYYDVAMKDTYTTDAGSKDMLDLIYDSIGSQKTMVIDDLLRAKNWATLAGDAWHNLLKADGFTGNAVGFSTKYQESYNKKNGTLTSVIQSWLKADAITYAE